MSYDYRVYCSKKPDEDFVTEFLTGRTGYECQGALGGQVGNCLVERNVRDTLVPAFTLDGPWGVEWEDIEESVAAVTLSPQWLVEISIPAGAIGKDRTIAKSIGQAIAKRFEGALHDPQEDQVVWPKSRPRTYKAPAEEERIRLVNLEWFLPFGVSADETALQVLAILRRYCPEAVPTRFGTFEPLQHKLEPGDDSGILAVWREVSEAPYGDSFFWKAKSPCFGGSVSYCDPRDDYRPAGAQRHVRLSVDFDGRALEADPRWCESVVQLFVRFAADLAAHFAAGYVERNVIAKRSVWYDGESESVALMRSRWWVGIPSKPTWLAWYGKPYCDHFSGVAGVQDLSGGLLLKTSELPLDSDQAAEVFPELPEDFVVSYDGDEVVQASVIPDL